MNTGSTGRIAEEIGRLAEKYGFESCAAYGRVDNGSQLKTIRIGSYADFTIHAVRTRLFDSHGFASRCATKKFVRKVEELKPDIIHLHNIHGYYINVEMLFDYLRQSGVPIIWTLHDCWPMTGHCSYFDYVGCDKWRTECSDCPNIKGYPSSMFLDRSRRNFRKKKRIFTSVDNMTFVTPSIWLKNVVTASFFKDYPVKVIYNGVDLDVFKPVDGSETSSVAEKYNLDMSKHIILGVASTWDRRKGLADFVGLSRMIGKSDKQVVLVGLTETQMKSLPYNIVGIRRTENVRELAALYSMSDVFVNPTWVDNFPTTNIEALACGTPVVTYRTGGSPEAVSDNTGMIVAKGDVKALHDAVLNIITRGKSVYQSACCQRAETMFDKNDRFMDYVKLYKSSLHVQ